jgi:hypothetical protein
MIPPRTPDDVIDLANAFFASRALLAGARAGVFAALAAGPKSAARVAAEAGLDPRATDILLHALAALELVEPRADAFALSSLARECLAPGAPRDLLDYLRLDADTFEAWSRLEEALATGRPIQVSSRQAAIGARERHQNFIRAMRASALGNAPIVARRLDLAAAIGREPALLLDLGGGPGLYAIELCRRWAGLRATVFDLAETVEIAREILAEEADPALAARVELRAGDFHVDPLGGPYDIAWVSHVVHGHPEPSLPPLFARIREALAPGGAVAIHDFILDRSRTRPRFGALFALNMLVMSDGGRTYSFEELRAMLAAQGFERIEWRDLGEGRGISVVLGRRG